LAVDEADDETSRVGYNVGLFARSSPEQPIGLQVELLYSTKGSTTNYTALFGLIEQEVDFNLNYLELPVLASFRIGGIVDIHAGAYAAYLMGAKATSSGDLGNGSEELDRDDFTSVDFGLAGGVGFNLGPNAQVGVRYLHGLTNVADSDVSDFVLGDAKNRCLQAYVAFGIGE
jgi:opacity protein-like surface antigen